MIFVTADHLLLFNFPNMATDLAAYPGQLMLLQSKLLHHLRKHRVI